MVESKIPSHKKEFRSQMKMLRAELLKPEAKAKKEQMEEAIRTEVLSVLTSLSNEKNIPETVYCYASFGSEVDTLLLMDALRKQGFSVALPRVLGDRMEFYLVKEKSDLVSGFHGILEPAEHCKRAECPQAVVITPGLAFTRAGERMGYGGGFYDRFFSEEPDHLKVAVCYPFQLVASLPTEEHDKRMDLVITGETV